MAASRHLSKVVSPLLCSRSMNTRKYSAVAGVAAMSVPEFEYYELPLPVLHDTHGQKTGRGPQWVFLGSPGVGKSTYARRLAELLNVPHISMGQLLRKEASLSTPFAKELANIMQQGKLVPDDIIFSILSKRLEKKIEFEESGFIFDGFPRTLYQAEVLDEVADIDLVVNLKLREDTLKKHMDRCSCPECGCRFDAPQEALGCCKTCKGLLITSGSADMGYMRLLRDKIRAHTMQCKPVEYHYRKQGKLLDLDVMGGIPHTWPRLLSVLRIEDKQPIMQHQLPV